MHTYTTQCTCTCTNTLHERTHTPHTHTHHTKHTHTQATSNSQNQLSNGNSSAVYNLSLWSLWIRWSTSPIEDGPLMLSTLLRQLSSPLLSYSDRPWVIALGLVMTHILQHYVLIWESWYRDNSRLHCKGHGEEGAGVM